MNTKFGDCTPEEMALQLRKLHSRVQTTRRENLSTLIVEINDLADAISNELKLDQALLDREKARYRDEFSFFDQINPFNTERKNSHRHNVKPVCGEVAEDRALLTRCCELLEWVRNASQPIEWRTNWRGGIAGAYNEHTGQVEWRESWHTGIAGVYHPDRQCIEWREQWKHGVAGVFNPIARVIEWRDNWHGGIAGVFNPKAQAIEWRDSFHCGVCGIYNPVSESVEWSESWKAGVAGAWSTRLNEIQWQEAWHHGVACVFYDGATYRSSCSFYGDEDDD